MGTSSIYGGHKDTSPLLPDDYDNNGDENANPDAPPEDIDTPSPPPSQNEPIPSNEKPWQAVKTAMSRSITGRSSNIREVMRKYGRAGGASKGLIRSSRAGIATGNRLAHFLTNGLAGASALSQQIRDIFQTEGDLRIALSRLADVLSPSPDDKESAVARDAVVNALCELYEYVDANKLDISSIENFSIPLQDQILAAYISEYIWGKMLNDLQICFEKNATNPQQAADMEKEYRAYIRSVVDVEVRKTSNSDTSRNALNLKGLFRNCYEVLIK